MSNPANSDRRRYSRQKCKHYLRVNGHDAILVDWSFSGLGIRFGDGIRVNVGEAVNIDILDPAFRGWENIEGVVCRIDQGNLIGVALDEADDKATNILIRLLGNSLAEIKNPETLSSPATSINSPTDHARATATPSANSAGSAVSLSDILDQEFEQ